MTERTSHSFIQDAVICVRAPVAVVSAPDGQLRAGAGGYYDADTRVLSRLVLTLDGDEPQPVDAQSLDASRARFRAVHWAAGDGGDASVSVERVRRAGRGGTGGGTGSSGSGGTGAGAGAAVEGASGAGQFARASAAPAEVFEEITVVNHGLRACSLRIALAAGCDLADISAVRAAAPPAGLPAAAAADGLVWGGDAAAAGGSGPTGPVRLMCDPAPDGVDAAAGTVWWQVELAPGGSWRQRLSLDADQVAVGAAVAAPATAAPPWSDVRVAAGDPRLARLAARSLDDLAGLLLADPLDRDDRFLAAGAPWYLTLFGRDSLWAARMLLPLGTELAAGTLRALARRQGAVNDPGTEEQPGKILHELRRGTTAPTGGLRLPPLYYGTIDATLLFVALLAEAWRWGMPHDEVAALVPHAERALGWLRDHADPDGDGFVEYVRTNDLSLANQGWKDSPDAVQTAAGELAGPPIALAEVQGYAYQAAMAGADLLDAFGRDGGAGWRQWAARLAERFRSAFWVEDADGPYVAIALDGRKRAVDAVSSNPGHLLGTGILNPAECTLVAERLAGPDMDSGWGLRTMSARSRGFNPLGYHTGSVWAHDTAITVAGLAATGHTRTAAALLDGLLDAAAAYDYRVPELHGGHPRDAAARPAPYPASCRPQAWSAAAGISLLTSLIGLRPDLPAGHVTLHPLHPTPLHITGLHLGPHPITVQTTPPTITGLPPTLTLRP